MFKNIFRQELFYWLKKPTFYFFGIVFFAFTFLTFSGSAGLFDAHAESGQLKEWLNSSYGVNFSLLYLNKLMVALIPAIVGVSIYKDFRYRMHSILYSFPINKTHYLGARLSASFSIVILIVLAVLSSMLLVEYLPGLDPAKMGPLHLSGYLHTFLVYLLPNLILSSSIVIAIIVSSRNIYAAFVGALIPFLLQTITENAFAGNSELIALFDPFGQNTLAYYTRDWSIIDKNTNSLPFLGLVCFNRLLWLGISATLIILSIRSFKLHEHLSARFKIRHHKSSSVIPARTTAAFDLSEVRTSYSKGHSWKTLWHLSVDGFRFIAISPMFLVINALGVLAMLLAVNFVTKSGEMILMPLTKILLMVPAASYTIISMLLIFIYSGLLINRERNARLEQLMDTTSTPFWVYWGSKLLAMVKVVLLLLAVFMGAGMVFQATNGYFHFEPSLYLYHLLIFMGIPLLIWTVAAFFVHTLFDNFYVGLFILIFGWVGFEGLPQVGIESYLIRFNTAPPVSYSDMNGYGIADIAFFIVEGYWMAFSLLLLTGVHVLWPYGVNQSLLYRLKSMANRRSPVVFSMAGLALILMLLLGSRIRTEETKKLNLSDGSFLQFENQFRKYEAIRSPKIRSLRATIELFPKNHHFTARGKYTVENPWTTAIDTLLLRTGFDERSKFNILRDHVVLAKDEMMKFYVVRLSQPLLPSEQFTLEFEIQNRPNSLFERNSNVLENGTFMKHDIFPRFGYSFKERSSDPRDSEVRTTHYQGLDSDLVDVHLTIGTESHQTAIAPGTLIRVQKKENRNYFEYQTEKPIKFSFGINSGNYHLYRSTETSVPL